MQNIRRCFSAILLFSVSIPISLNSCFNLIDVVPNAPTTTTEITFTGTSNIFFNFLCRLLWYFILPFYLSSILLSKGYAKSIILRSFWVSSIITISGLLASMTWSVCIVKSHNIFQESFCTVFSGLCLHHISFISKPIFLHIFQCAFLPTQPCLLLYSLSADMGHPHTICLNFSYTFPYNLHLISVWVLSNFVFITFVLMVCCCSAVISDSISLFMLPSFSHRHFSSPATTLIWLKNCPCNFFYFNKLIHSFLLLFLNTFTLSVIPRCCL